jgi:aspartokinase
MQAFWSAFAQFFGMLTSLFSAGEKAARTLDNIAGVGEIKSSTYLKEAVHDQEVAVDEFKFAREKRVAELNAKRAALTAPAANP